MKMKEVIKDLKIKQVACGSQNLEQSTLSIQASITELSCPGTLAAVLKEPANP